MTKIAVLGAGLSGLVAARTLAAQDHEVVVFDKGRGGSGRLATRRIGEQARFDHGAQFFTVRGDDFGEWVEAGRAAGVIDVWCHGFGEADGYPRYYCPDGMTAFGRWLREGLDVVFDRRAAAIEPDGDGVRFVDDTGAVLAGGEHAIVTSPIPQTLTLFDAGGVKLGHEVAHQLKGVDWFSTLALLVTVDGDANVDEPGGMQLTDGPFTFIADNKRKGVSPVGALTFHANHDYSARRFDDDEAEVLEELLALAAPWIGDARVEASQLKKWRYAGPVNPLPDPTMLVPVGSAQVALAGDAFGGPKVEGAFNSGRAAAAALLAI